MNPILHIWGTIYITVLLIFLLAIFVGKKMNDLPPDISIRTLVLISIFWPYCLVRGLIKYINN